MKTPVRTFEQHKRQFVIDELLAYGVTTSIDGIYIYELNYDDLKYELTLAAFREIDILSDSNKWF